MRTSRLPKELISLIYNIELNKVDWFNRFLCQAISGILWLANKPLDNSEISQGLTTWGIHTAMDKIKKAIDTLLENNTINRLPEGKYKLFESYRKDFEEQVESAEVREKHVKKRFRDLLSGHCPQLDPQDTWEKFNEELLIPKIQEWGARFFEIFHVGRSVDIETATIEAFLAFYPENLHYNLRELILEVLDPTDVNIRSYLLNILDAYLVKEAAGLSETTIRLLQEETRPEFNILVDTNFIFSILSLHENPSNESAQKLFALINSVKDKISVTLYVAPITIDETRSVISWHKSMLGDTRITPHLAEVDIRGELSGISQKYFEAVKTSQKEIRPEQYFSPYEKGLVRLLREKGVELFNVKTFDELRQSQKVIDDILGTQKHEEEKYGNRAKTYEKLEHDITLWHFCNDNRPAYLESPINAKYWIVTIDYRLLGFDCYKHRNSQDSIRICLHPNQLIQLLRFWVPRDPKYDEAVFSIFRLPIFFQEFEPNAERTVLKILNVLGRFEEIDDIPIDCLRGILRDQALRQRIKPEENEENKIEFVKTALAEQLKQSEQKQKSYEGNIKLANKTIRELKDELKRRNQRIKLSDKELQTEREKRNIEEQRSRKLEKKAKNINYLFPPLFGFIALIVFRYSLLLSPPSEKVGYST